MLNKKTYPAAHFLNKLWAYVVFFLCLTPCKVDFRFKRNKNQAYIYCPNHTSYLDIPTLCYSLPGYFIFVGKSSLGKVPLFGYMFRTLYISVDRSSRMSSYRSYVQSCNAIDNKRSIVLFPEGKIPAENHPKLIHFKEGAFRIAIEKQVPIVPVTIPNNWKILPDFKEMVVNRHVMRVVFHEPIETKGMTMDDLNELRSRTFAIIDQELKKHNKHIE
ncbi:MAG: lysophospholipid acyltransferase family protein [Cytophagaceae bacterium]